LRNAPEKTPLTPWPRTEEPWQRLQSDYFGPIWGYHFLVTVDSHSKWIEAFRGNTPTSEFTVQCLRQQFARFGIPDSHISDNGTAFTSEHTKKFLKANGVYQGFTAPYNPATNGLAENAVKTIKRALIKKLGKEPRSKDEIDKALQNILMEYRNTPHSTTGISPARALLGRNLKDILTQVLPKKSRLALKHHEIYQNNIERQKKNYKGNRLVSFIAGEEVYVRCYKNSNKPSWVRAKIIEKISEKTYRCKLISGHERKVHVDQIQTPVVKTSSVDELEGESNGSTSICNDTDENISTGRAIKSQSKLKRPKPLNGNNGKTKENGNFSKCSNTLINTEKSSTEFFDCKSEPQNTVASETSSHVASPKIPPLQELSDMDRSALSGSISQNPLHDERPLAVRRQRRNIRPPKRLYL
jgi:hypothetical protein